MQQAVKVPTGDLDARMRRFVKLYTEVWAHARAERIGELWTEDAVIMHPEFTEPLHGPEAVRDYLRACLQVSPDLEIRPLAAAANGDTLYLQFRGEGTFAGQKIVWEGVDRFDLVGEKAARGHAFFDTHRMREAVARLALAEAGEH